MRALSGNQFLSRQTFTYLEGIKDTWPVGEVKREVGGPYFEHSGLFHDPIQLFELSHAAKLQADPAHSIRDSYVFELLGFSPSEALPVSGLEDARIEKMRSFMLELGSFLATHIKNIERAVRQGKHIHVRQHFFPVCLKMKTGQRFLGSCFAENTVAPGMVDSKCLGALKAALKSMVKSPYKIGALAGIVPQKGAERIGIRIGLVKDRAQLPHEAELMRIGGSKGVQAHGSQEAS